MRKSRLTVRQALLLHYHFTIEITGARILLEDYVPMTDTGRKHQILLTIHGNKKTADQERFIPASVFKSKFSDLLGALKEADRAINAKAAHNYVVSHLKIGSAEFGLLERQGKAFKRIPHSSVVAVYDCANAIYRSNFNAAKRFNGVAEKLQKLVSGVEESFEYMEFTDPDVGSITFDGVFKNQIDQFISEKAVQSETVSKHFRGEAFDSFDCEFLELDFRGRNSRGILVLTGTKVEIPCVFGATFSEESMKDHLKQRIWVIGNAIYDGNRAVPARIEVARMQKINQTGRPSDWKGTLMPFEISDWEAGADVQSKQ
jgi:hypothetical protein